MPSPEIIGVIFLVLMIVLLFTGMYIGIVLGIIGLAGCAVLMGMTKGMSILANTTYYALADYRFIALPMFMMMGEIAYQGGIGTLLYAAISKWIGHLHGGLAMATTAANALFGTICGDSLSATATFGKIAVPEMIKHGYDKGLSSAVVAAAGCLAVLIPPSGIMILYCIFTEVSLGRLMMAGFIPGAISGILYMAYIYTRVKLKPSLAPSMKTVPSLKERVYSIRWIFPLAVVVIVMFGGIYMGVFSPVEAGAIGAFTVFIVVFARRSLPINKILPALSGVARNVAMVFLVIAGAMVFGKFIMYSGIPSAINIFIENLNVSPLIVLIIILVIYLLLGCIMSVVAMLSITLPVFYPLMTGLGYDGIWFGIIVILTCEIAAMTPPVGLNVYVLKAVVGDLIDTGSVFRGVFPFVILNIVMLALLTALPQLVLWLPSMMYGK